MNQVSVGLDDMLSVGLTGRQVDYWTRRGYLKPLPGPGGSGHARRFPAGERDVAATMVRMVRAGVAPETAHEVARQGGDAEVAPGVRVIVTPLPGHPPATPAAPGPVDTEPKVRWRGDVALANAAAVAQMYGVSERTVRRYCPVVEYEERAEPGTGQALYDAIAAGEHLDGIAARPDRTAAALRARRTTTGPGND